MRKHIILISLLAAALGSGTVALGAGPGGGKGSGPVSQGVENQNAQTMEDATRGQQRAEERRKQLNQTQLKEQERLRVQDGSGPMHEQRTMTKQENQVKTGNEAQIQQKAKTQVKPKGQPELPLQTQQQIQEQSQQQLRIDK